MKACDCIHEPGHHDPKTGACLYTNPSFGPCPCAATPPESRAALQRVYDTLKKVTARDSKP